jgi:acetyl esterase/lipase
MIIYSKNKMSPVSKWKRFVMRQQLLAAQRKAFCLSSSLLLCLYALDASAQNIARVVPWATPQYTVTVQDDIVYGQGEINGGGSFKDLKLDLYIPDVIPPEGAQNQFPLMIMIHGGAFLVGDKKYAPVVSYAQQFAARGWLVASISYRLLRDSPVPSPRLAPMVEAQGGPSTGAYVRAILSAVDDSLTAIDYLQARDDVNPNWTTLFGMSAGAITSLITAYSLDDYGIARPPVAAVMDNWGGVYDFSVGNPFDDPNGTDPVLLIVHGTQDATVPYSEALKLQSWAINAGLPLDFQPVAGAGHGADLLNTNASTGVTLLQRQVDYHHETVFDGLEQGPQPALPPGC